jgi:hypothetical protein
MTQIVQGKQREMQPLIRKKKSLMQHPDYTEAINFGHLTPQHQPYSFPNPPMRHCRTVKQQVYGMEPFTPHFNRMNCPTPDQVTQ